MGTNAPEEVVERAFQGMDERPQIEPIGRSLFAAEFLHLAGTALFGRRGRDRRLEF